MSNIEKQLKKKEIMVPIRLIVILFVITLFLCLLCETEAEQIAFKNVFYFIVISWQIIFGLIAITRIKRPTLFYMFTGLFLLPTVLVSAVFSYVLLYPFFATHQLFIITLMFVGIFLNFYLSFLGFGVIFKETLQANQESGRFDLKKGLFSFAVAPRMHDPKNLKLKRISNFLMINLGAVVFIGPVISFYVSKSSSLHFKDVYGAIISYLMALVMGWAVSGCFYNYWWLRSWEKESGRNMLTQYV